MIGGLAADRSGKDGNAACSEEQSKYNRLKIGVKGYLLKGLLGRIKVEKALVKKRSS